MVEETEWSDNTNIAHPNTPVICGPTPSSVPTYRHLLSSSTLTPSNPLRVIAHCDVDAAYAQFEAARLGYDSMKVPLAVQQWQGLIAISYAARAYGISRHETVTEAKKKCPHLVLVHVSTYAEGAEHAAYHKNPRPETHKVSLDPYRRESKKIMGMFKELCPDAMIEKASIDESYFDLTSTVRKHLLSRYPHLQHPPDDFPLGLDTPLPTIRYATEWKPHFGFLVPFQPLEAPVSLRNKRNESEEKMQDERGGAFPEDPSWTDIALSVGAEIMADVRNGIMQKIGYSTSTGLATCKTLAKLCSSYRKPNAQTTILPRSTLGFLRDLPIQKIRFLGGKLGDLIAAEWGSSTIGDLWKIELSELKAKFGDESTWVYNTLRGIDHSEVVERIKNKTMLASKSVRPPLRKTSDAMHWLSILCTELVIRLKEAQEELPTLWPRTLVLRSIKAGETPRSRQVAFPYTSELQHATLFRVAERLWLDMFGEQMDATYPVTTISLGFTGLEAEPQGQTRIESFLRKPSAMSNSPVSKKRVNEGSLAEHTLSNPPIYQPPKVEARSPEEGAPCKIQKTKADVQTTNQNAALEEHTGSEEHARIPDVSVNIPGTLDAAQTNATPAIHDRTWKLDWSCPQCGDVLEAPPAEYFSSSGITANAEHDSHAACQHERQLYLQRLRQDHEDWHFAYTLQNQDERSSPASFSNASSTAPSTLTPTLATHASSSSSKNPCAPSNRKGKAAVKKGTLSDFLVKRNGSR